MVNFEMKSDNIKKGLQRAPHRSLLRACGVTDEEMERPFIGVVNSFTDIVPGHIHLNQVSEAVKLGVSEAGGVPFEFNTMAICDGIAMNHEGMRYSLASREIIADTRNADGSRQIRYSLYSSYWRPYVAWRL